MFERRAIDAHRLDEAGAHVLAGGARRFLIKSGQETLRFDAALTPLTDAKLRGHSIERRPSGGASI